MQCPRFGFVTSASLSGTLLHGYPCVNAYTQNKCQLAVGMLQICMLQEIYVGSSIELGMCHVDCGHPHSKPVLAQPESSWLLQLC